MESMLQLNPNKRLTATEALNHPYLTSESPLACKNHELPITIKK